MSPVRTLLRFRSAACFAAALTLSPLCAAHEVVPPDWCVQEQSEPQILARFEFDGPQLATLVQKCGIVEKDRWLAASQALIEHCRSETGRSDAVPFVFGPDSYLSERHHEVYRLEDGARGACAVCPPKPDGRSK